jgi:hypothetical protein
MVQKESLQPDDWHRRGEADLSAAEILLAVSIIHDIPSH